MDAIQTIALLTAGISLAKLAVVLVQKKTWYEYVVQPVYKYKDISAAITIGLAAIVFYYLQQTMTYAQLFSTMAFVSLLIGAGMMQHSKETLQFAKKIYSKKMAGWTLLLIIIWLLLCIKLFAEVL